MAKRLTSSISQHSSRRNIARHDTTVGTWAYSLSPTHHSCTGTTWGIRRYSTFSCGKNSVATYSMHLRGRGMDMYGEGQPTLRLFELTWERVRGDFLNSIRLGPAL